MSGATQLTKACSDCPFRRGTLTKLTRSRCEELREVLEKQDGHFHCHKTVDYGGEQPKTEESSFCVGSLQLFGFGQLPRIAGRMGMLPKDIVTDDPGVHTDPDEWIEDCGVL